MKQVGKTIRQKFAGHPKGLYVLFYTEMWELFGRFGITAMLILYLTHRFKISDGHAAMIYSGFMAMVFILPVIGGFFTDKKLGKYNAIIIGCLIMMSGNLLLIIPYYPLIIIGLSVIAVGSGLFLPNIPPLVGSLYEAGSAEREAGFTIYYMGKNVGALFAPVICGLIAKYTNYNWAFIVTAIGMLSGFLVFVNSLHDLPKDPDAYGSDRVKMFSQSINVSLYLLLIPIVYIVLRFESQLYAVMATLLIAGSVFSKYYRNMSLDLKKRCLLIGLLVSFILIYEAFLGEGGTTLNLFIDRMIDKNILGFDVPTTFFFALDPVFLLALGPIIAMLWTKLGKSGREPLITSKFALAFVLLALGFFVFYGASIVAEHYQLAPPYFIVMAYILFPLAELCILPPGISMIDRLAPPSLHSSSIGVMMLAMGIASYLTGVISQLADVSNANIYVAARIYKTNFGITAIILGLIAIIAYITRFMFTRHLAR